MKRMTLTALLGASLLVAAPALCSPATAAPQNTTRPTPKPTSRPDAKSASKAVIGEEAPKFTLKNAKGKEFKLEDYLGKIVVLQWINPDCPVCKRVTSNGLLSNMLKECKKVDESVVHLTIDSTHYADATAGQKYLKEHRIKSPALIDKDGAVGKLYGARTTPHMFVIDQKGILRFDGAFDDDFGKGSDESTNYVVSAVTQITAGETVSPDKVKPFGCSVKYANGGKGKGKGRRGGGGRRGRR